jgi:hypothetical protein
LSEAVMMMVAVVVSDHDLLGGEERGSEDIRGKRQTPWTSRFFHSWRILDLQVGRGQRVGILKSVLVSRLRMVIVIIKYPVWPPQTEWLRGGFWMREVKE